MKVIFRLDESYDIAWVKKMQEEYDWLWFSAEDGYLQELMKVSERVIGLNLVDSKLKPKAYEFDIGDVNDLWTDALDVDSAIVYLNLPEFLYEWFVLHGADNMYGIFRSTDYVNLIYNGMQGERVGYEVKTVRDIEHIGDGIFEFKPGSYNNMQDIEELCKEVKYVIEGA